MLLFDWQTTGIDSGNGYLTDQYDLDNTDAVLNTLHYSTAQ